MKKTYPLGLSEKAWEKLISKYGHVANELLLVCPYQLAIEQDIPFAAADEYVMSKSKVDRLCPKRIANALHYTLKAIERGVRANENDAFSQKVSQIAGSTCLPKSMVYDFVEELLGLEEGSITLPLLDLAIRNLACQGKISVNRIDDQIFLATKRTYRAEIEAAEKVKKLLSKEGIVSKKDSDKERMYKKVVIAMAKTEMILSQEQKNAVCMILQNRISVLTGGPGTGKSAALKILIESAKLISPSIRIMCIAPTGMAASRMQEATGCPAATIHKALGLMPGATKSRKILDADLVLVDESSMLDIFIFSALLESISEKTSVCFIGDVSQLPSIAAGNILENLILSKVPVAELTKVFRQGDNSIAFNCAKIKSGATDLDEDASFMFIDCKDSNEIQKEVQRIYKEEAEKKGIDSVCCLTPYRRKTKTGVNQLNRTIRSGLGIDERSGYSVYDGMRIYAGDKITYLRNNNGLVNGDTGTAVECFKDTCVARFGDREIILTGEELSSIEPSFAQTVHKAQGQEYKTCIIVCDEAHTSFLSRNLVYTSISRAKEKCICVGSRNALKNAILQKSNEPERFGALTKLINR